MSITAMQAISASALSPRCSLRTPAVIKPHCSCQCLSARPFSSGTSIPARHLMHTSRRQTQQRKVVTMGLFGLGGPELAVIAGVAVLIFGPSKIPGLGKEVGKAAKSFQQAAREFESELKSNAEETASSVESGAESASDRKAKAEREQKNKQ